MIFGTLYYPGWIPNFRIAMATQNLATRLLPLTFRLVVATDVMDFLSSDLSDHSLIVALEMLHPRDYSERLHLGAEYQFLKAFAFRAGYKFNYDEEGLTLGAGFEREFIRLKLRVDYAWSEFGDVFDPVQRFTFGLSL